MEIPKSYDHLTKDQEHYQEWMEHGFFHSEPDEREAYTVLIPPPNVTGVLHMGHMLNNTIQDVLVRRARLLGKNACWVPGTDHASIATEAKVVKKLASEGIKKTDLSREQFLKSAWEWTEKYGGTIFSQLQRLGASCDWERSRFTLDKDLYDAVIKVFVDLHQKGLIYRGVRMVNWDPTAQTALSDEEVVHREVKSNLYYIDYEVEGEDQKLTIATTRPETILGDTAICIHPEDERYRHLKGKRAIVPIVGRSIPIIEDEYVDREFGTACLKVTPAHDLNDYELGLKHNLPSIDILNDDGTLSEAAQQYVGKDRFQARESIIADLKQMGKLSKVEEIANKIGFSERTDAVIEPKLSMQWFLKMEALSQPALAYVMQGEIRFFPKNSVNTFRHWMENIKDWCISRQLWWGHQIPAYYYGAGSNDYVIAENSEEALQLAREKSGNDQLQSNHLKQDEDVLDTWFSSWLWPISVFDGFKEAENKEINYYFPTDDLVTAPDIMFFWVARMIMASHEYKGKPPFKNVYFTGMVRDKQGRKMSKQLGNSPDPIELIEKHGADGVRVGMLLSSPAGNDLLFDQSLCEQGRNFSNKLWNALRLLKSWEVDDQVEETEAAAIGNQWFASVFSKNLDALNHQFDQFRISDALMIVYRLAWDEFCSWYLEMVKPGKGQKMAKKTYGEVVEHFENLLRILHPFMPFISEEIYQQLKEREEKDYLIVDHWPQIRESDQLAKAFEHSKKVIAEVRSIRKKNQISFKQELSLIVSEQEGKAGSFDPILKKLLHLSEVSFMKKPEGQHISFVVGLKEYFIPMQGKINPEEERKKLEEEMEYHRGFLKAVDKKLSNQAFVDNAPEKVVEMEKQKKSDAEAKIDLLQKKIDVL